MCGVCGEERVCERRGCVRGEGVECVERRVCVGRRGCGEVRVWSVWRGEGV